MSKYIKLDDAIGIITEHQGIRGDTFKALHNVCAVDIVWCKDCRHANECHKSVQYTRNEANTVTIGYSPIKWCSRGERKEGARNEKVDLRSMW